MGFDGVQALYLAMQQVGVLIYSSPYHRQGLISWGDAGGYGFPMRMSARDVAIGLDKEM